MNKTAPSLRKRFLSLSFVALLAVLIVVVASFSMSYYNRMQATKMLEVLSSLEVGHTTDVHAREVLKPFSRYLSGQESAYAQYQFTNGVFGVLHLAPRTSVSAEVAFENGVVVEKSLNYFEEPRCGGVLQEVLKHSHFDDERPHAGNGDRYFYVGSSVPSPDFIMKVRDNTDVPSARRRLDWQVDLTCMTTMGGCRDPRKVLRGTLLESTN